MRKSLLNLIAILLIGISCKAQTSTTKYYKDISLSKKVCAKKAKFAHISSLSNEGKSIEEVWRLGDSQLVVREEYRLGEPYGLWIHSKGQTKVKLDYDFELSYSDKKCSDSIFGLSGWDYFSDQPIIEYLAPKLEHGNGDIGYFISRNLIFPKSMIETGIEGVVVVNFTITANGEVENICINEPSFDVSMNKEAQRVIRLLKFSGGAKLLGKAVSLCLSVPIRFEFR